ncbi:MAG: DUF6794 domain-containing protein [Planctomycetota bacterium]
MWDRTPLIPIPLAVEVKRMRPRVSSGLLSLLAILIPLAVGCSKAPLPKSEYTTTGPVSSGPPAVMGKNGHEPSRPGTANKPTPVKPGEVPPSRPQPVSPEPAAKPAVAEPDIPEDSDDVKAVARNAVSVGQPAPSRPTDAAGTQVSEADQPRTTGDSAKEKTALMFRCAGGTNTTYFVFRSNGEYVFMAREHLFSAVLEEGTWQQDKRGQLTLTPASGSSRGKVFHMTPVAYRSCVALASPDHDLVKIWASTPEDVKKRIDDVRPGEHLRRLFVAVDVETFQGEWKTPQPFRFYPELNKRPGPHPVLRSKGDSQPARGTGEAAGEGKSSPQSIPSVPAGRAERESSPERGDATRQRPTSIDEAVSIALAAMSDKDKLACKRTRRADLIKYHHGLGTWIRNRFDLWGGNAKLMAACKKRRSRLTGRYWAFLHPDDASMVILDALWKRLQTVPLKNEERAWRLWRMAENYLTNGAREAANAELQKAIRLYPDTDHAKMARAKLEMLTGKAE